MADLKIKYGKNLNSSNVPLSAGTLYLDTNEDELYYDDPAGIKTNHQKIGLKNIKDGSSGGSIRTSQSMEEDGMYTIGENAFAEGKATKASGSASHAEGYITTSSGYSAHVEGFKTEATGDSSHAEGAYNKSTGENSHAEGRYTDSKGKNSHAEGTRTIAEGEGAHAEGRLTQTMGEFSHAEGLGNQAIGNGSHAEGGAMFGTLSIDQKAQCQILDKDTILIPKTLITHIERLVGINLGTTDFYIDQPEVIIDEQNIKIIQLDAFLGMAEYPITGDKYNEDISICYGSLASGYGSHAEGGRTVASGSRSHAEGYRTEAIGDDSHAEGDWTVSSGDSSHAENRDTIASGKYSHAEGRYAEAIGKASHAEGGQYTSNDVLAGDRTIDKTDIPELAETTIIVAGPQAYGTQSHAEGCQTLAYGNGSHAEGRYTIAFGEGAHAEGNWTKATNLNAHAEGTTTQAISDQAHAEGYGTIASALHAHAEGCYTEATAIDAHAEGRHTRASSEHSHSEGEYTIASGHESHAEGNYTTASGSGSHAEGGDGYHELSNSEKKKCSITDKDTILIPISLLEDQAILVRVRVGNFYFYKYKNEIVIDENNIKCICLDEFSSITSFPSSGNNYAGKIRFYYASIAEGDGSHAEGRGSYAYGTGSHAEGRYTIASGEYSHAEGYYSEAYGDYSHAENRDTVASGSRSHAEGYYSKASGQASHAEGGQYNKEATSYIPDLEIDRSIIPELTENSIIIPGPRSYGTQSHAEGTQTLAYGYGSHSEGLKTIAQGDNSHAEGESTIAKKKWSHAEGRQSLAAGDASHSEGYKTEAAGVASHAEGYGGQSLGWYSHAEGWGTLANTQGGHAQGTYNTADTEEKYLHIVGNGTSNTARSNAHTIDKSGNCWYAGHIYCGGTAQDAGATDLTNSVSTISNDVNNLKQKIETSVTKDYVTQEIANAKIIQYKSPISTAFQSDADTPDFPYAAKVSLPGVVPGDYVIVNFTIQQLAEGIYAPFCRCGYNDYVWIYASSNPGKTLTLDNVIVIKDINMIKK